MKIKKPFLIIGTITVVAVVILVSVLFIFNSSKDISDIVGKSVSISEGLKYCEGVDDIEFEDSMSKAFISTVKFKVISIDEKESKVTIEISAPPIKQILSECLPTNIGSDYEEVFEGYIRSVYKELHADHETGTADNK